MPSWNPFRIFRRKPKAAAKPGPKKRVVQPFSEPELRMTAKGVLELKQSFARLSEDALLKRLDMQLPGLVKTLKSKPGAEKQLRELSLALGTLLKRGTPAVRCAAVGALVSIGNTEAVGVLKARRKEILMEYPDIRKIGGSDVMARPEVSEIHLIDQFLGLEN